MYTSGIHGRANGTKQSRQTTKREWTFGRAKGMEMSENDENERNSKIRMILMQIQKTNYVKKMSRLKNCTNSDR